jgi:hypothetical protein
VYPLVRPIRVDLDAFEAQGGGYQITFKVIIFCNISDALTAFPAVAENPRGNATNMRRTERNAWIDSYRAVYSVNTPAQDRFNFRIVFKLLQESA